MQIPEVYANTQGIAYFQARKQEKLKKARTGISVNEIVSGRKAWRQHVPDVKDMKNIWKIS